MIYVYIYIHVKEQKFEYKKPHSELKATNYNFKVESILAAKSFSMNITQTCQNQFFRVFVFTVNAY